MKVATFTVHADIRQSARWKQAAEARGHASTGTWIAEAVDRYLDALKRAGRPIPLAWNRFGRFTVRLMDGRGIEVPGRTSPPFGIYRGNAMGPLGMGAGRHSLVFLPGARIVATLASERHCKELASELSRVWVRWGGSEPVEDPAKVVERFQREDT
ncbi:MAG TPA: hypothetical protein VGH73_16845 [Thermoanaerobaculia bacterium]